MKNVSINSLAMNGGLRNNSIGCGGERMRKTTNLMPSLTSFYWTDQLFSEYLVPELEDNHGEQREVLIIQVEIVSYLLHH